MCTLFDFTSSKNMSNATNSEGVQFETFADARCWRIRKVDSKELKIRCET